MRLSHYLFLIVSAVFALLSAGIEVLYVAGTREFLRDQMEVHSQETATSLAMSISASAGGTRDVTLVDTILSPVFDRGQFSRIAVLGADGTPVAARERPPVAPDVPAWFMRLLPLAVPGGEALINSGWKQLGRVVVVPHPALAYRHLWLSTLEATAWLAFLYVLAIIALRLLLGVILHTLVEIERAARDLGDRKFSAIAIAPRVRELKVVVATFNALSAKIRAEIAREQARAQELERDAFNDALTGLNNRRGFEHQFRILFESGASHACGVLVILELDGLERYRETAGFGRTEDLLRLVADVIRSQSAPANALTGRIGGASFAVACANLDTAQARATAAALARETQAAVARVGAQLLVAPHAGAARFDAFDHDFTGLLGAADLALNGARSIGAGAAELTETSETGVLNKRGSSEWRSVIVGALADDRLVLVAQPALSLPDNALMHTEIGAWLDESDGHPVEARLFVPMALRHGLGPQLDATVLTRVLARLERDAPPGQFALNVSGQSIRDAGFTAQLKQALARNAALAPRLVFETSEAGLLEDAEAARAFAQLVRGYGAQFAIDNFYVSGDSLQRLETLLPAYIKLSMTYTAGLESNAEARFLVSSLARITHPLDIPIIAQGVESAATVAALTGLGISGLQGYEPGRPQPW